MAVAPAYGQAASGAPAAATVQPAVLGADLRVQDSANPSPILSQTPIQALPAPRTAIQAEPFFITPLIAVGFGHDDNIRSQSTNKEARSFYLVSPRLRADAKSALGTVVLGYAGNLRRYTGGDGFAYDDHELTTSLRNRVTARFDYGASVFHLMKTDPPGLTARPILTDPDRWTATGINGTVGYGAPSAQGRVEFDLGTLSKRYENNREFTNVLDVDTTTAAGRFLYRLAPATRGVAEFTHASSDYPSAPNRASTTETLAVGLNWDITSITSGRARIGQQRRTVQDPAAPAYSGLYADASVAWQASQATSLFLSLQRTAQDATGLAVYSVNDSIGAGWTQRWRSNLSSRLQFTHLNQDFKGLGRTDRIDLSHQTRSSSVQGFDMQKNVILLSAGMTL